MCRGSPICTHTATEIHFDEVELQRIKIQTAVLCLVLVYAGTDSSRLAIVERGAGVVPGISVDTGLEPLAMDILYHRLQTAGKLARVDQQIALGIPAGKEAVVDVDIAISHTAQSCRHERIGLPTDQTIADTGEIGVPGTRLTR